MKNRACFTASFLLFLLAACSDGGSSTSTPTVPVPPVAIAISLESAGIVATNVPGIDGGVVLVTSQASLGELSSGRFTVPDSARDIDFGSHTLIYIEGQADNDFTSTVRIKDLLLDEYGDYTLLFERCGAEPVAPLVHRPFALYLAPKISGSVGVSATSLATGCTTVTTVQATLVAAGTFVGACCMSPRPPVRVDSQARLDALLPQLAPGSVPAQYLAPDFGQVTLIYVEGAPDNVPDSYVRILQAFQSTNGSRDFIAEQCGPEVPFNTNHVPYALYAVPRFDAAARVARFYTTPPACLTSR